MFNHKTCQDIVLKSLKLKWELENVNNRLSPECLLQNIWNGNTHALEMKYHPEIENSIIKKIGEEKHCFYAKYTNFRKGIHHI